MLQQMRSFAKSWIATALLAVIMLSFVIWGIADVFRGSADTSIATVGTGHWWAFGADRGKTIEQAEFQREYDNVLRNQSARLGTPVTAQQARQLGLPKETLDRMINRDAIDLVVSRVGLVASDSEVAAQIREVPQFQDTSGSFDKMRFAEVLRQSGFTEQGFVEAIRSDMVRGQLINATSDGLGVPAGYAKAFFDYLYEVRAVNYVTVPANATGPLPQPADPELMAYVKQHAAHFSTPEYREFSYVAITPDALAAQIPVSDAQVQNEYELHRSDYQIPEKRVVEQISFPDEKSAKEAQAKLAGGTTFDDLAISRGLKTNDLQLGAVSEADLGGERGKAVFALQPGQVSAPVKSLLGYVLLKVVAINPGVNKTFADVKPALTADVRRKLAVDKIGDMVNKLQDAIAGGDNLTKAAQTIGLTPVHVKAMDGHGMAPDGTKVQIPANPQFLAQVLKADAGPPGDPFQAQDGSAYVIQVDGVTPPKLKPFAMVRDEAAKAWSAQKAQDALLDRVKTLVAEANRAGSLDPVVKALNAKVQQSPAMQRTAQSETFPAYLTAQIFEAPPGGTVMGKTADGANFVIARVTGIAHPPAGVEQLREYLQFKGQIANQIAADIPTSFAKAARQRAGVAINQKNFDSITGNGQ